MTGIGVVEIETRIDDIKQQLRKCDISRCKAEARLKAIKQGKLTNNSKFILVFV